MSITVIEISQIISMIAISIGLIFTAMDAVVIIPGISLLDAYIVILLIDGAVQFISGIIMDD